MYGIYMTMTHRKVSGNTVIAHIQIGEAATLNEADSLKILLARFSCIPGNRISDLRQTVFSLNPQAGAVHTEFTVVAI